MRLERQGNTGLNNKGKIEAAISGVLGRLNEDPQTGPIVRDAQEYRRLTECTPWAETYVGEEAEAIRRKHSSGGDLDAFEFAWRLVSMLPRTDNHGSGQ